MSFEWRDPGRDDILPKDCHGAVGWMGVIAEDGDDVRDLVEACLAQIGLRLIEIAELQPAGTMEEVSEQDAHLASNLEALETGKVVVWGTLHTYLAEGEAYSGIPLVLVSRVAVPI